MSSYKTDQAIEYASVVFMFLILGTLCGYGLAWLGIQIFGG